MVAKIFKVNLCTESVLVEQFWITFSHHQCVLDFRVVVLYVSFIPLSYLFTDTVSNFAVSNKDFSGDEGIGPSPDSTSASGDEVPAVKNDFVKRNTGCIFFS